ncbi:MAG: aldehyde dehydrogenase family protein [Caulobacterales bacterium]
MTCEALTRLTAGMPIVFGGDRVTHVSDELAARFAPGDRLIVVQETGELLHVPAAVRAIADAAVARAHAAFQVMTGAPDAAISGFFEAFAARLATDQVWAAIAEANARDVASAKARGRSTTRLAVSDAMRRDMIDGLREWRDAAPSRDRVVERIDHEGWSVEQVTAPLGVVGFVFEGRPNVFADAAGVLRGANTVVFRIGGDALGTAQAIVRHALDPALAEAGLPVGACTLVESAEHAAGWALFSDQRLALAVARGSGQAVAQLGAVARQAGVPISLHGTGGAWLVADAAADADRFAAAVLNSLDRKVCNTLNVCCIVRERAGDLVPIFLRALEQAGERRGHGARLHVVEGDEGVVPAAWWDRRVKARRADGDHDEPLVELLPEHDLGREWEWEETPEVTLKVVASVEAAAELFNRYSPQFIASLISEDPAAHARFYAQVNAGFVGDGFTRWVDGQYALNRPELGLSNWQHGRLFARGGVLSGDSVFTVRTRMRQADAQLKR